MSKLSDLAHALYEKTMEKKIEWEIQDDNSISINIGKNSVNVVRYSYEDRSWFIFSIENIAGVTLDKERFDSSDEIYNSLEEMMFRARRDSLRVDETLDEILEKVGKL